MPLCLGGEHVHVELQDNGEKPNGTAMRPLDIVLVFRLATCMRIIVSGLALGLLCTLAPPLRADTNDLAKASWPVGEKITYKLYWGFIPVGTAIVWTEWTELNSRRLLAIRLRTTSNKVIEKIYPVNDTIESLVDPDTFLPVQFTKNMSEGSSRHHEITTFDRTNLVAHWESMITHTTKVFRIEADTHDIPSLMYHLRNRTFTPGQREHFKVMADEKIYDLWVNVQKQETIDLPNHDDVRCLKIEPEAAFNGLFVRKGRMWVWISADPRCVAARIEASIPVANVHALLLTVEGPGNDRWVSSPKAR